MCIRDRSTGTLQGQKPMDGGWWALATNAQVTHGNSGGPVLDSRGRVLGIVSFATTNATGAVEGDGFFVPAEVLRETLDKATAKPVTGTLTSLYYQALSQGDFRHYRHELAILSQVQTRSPWHAYVKDDISATQSAVLSGKDETPPELSGLQKPAAGAAGGAAVLAAVTLLALRLRRRKLVNAEAVTGPAEPNPSVDIAPDADLPEHASSPNGADKETIPIV